MWFFFFCSYLTSLVSSVARNTNDWSAARLHLAQRDTSIRGRLYATLLAALSALYKCRRSKESEKEPAWGREATGMQQTSWPSDLFMAFLEGKKPRKDHEPACCTKWCARIYLPSNNARHKTRRGWGNASTPCEVIERLGSGNKRVLFGGTRKDFPCFLL